MTTQAKHTPVNLETSVLSNGTEWTVCEAGGGDMLADLSQCDHQEANAKRLVNCWNHHDEMADALREVRWYINSDKLRWSENANLPVRQFEDRLAALLAKLDGAK